MAGDANFAKVPLLLHGNGPDGSDLVRDHSLSRRTLTLFGNARIRTTQSKFNGSALYLDGTDDYVTVPSDAAFSAAGQALTVEFFFYAEALKLAGLVGKRPSNGANATEWTVYLNATGQLSLFAWSAAFAIAVNMPAAGTAVTANTWNHAAFTRSAAGVWRLFLNGVKQQEVTETAAIGTNTTALHIGRDASVPTTRDFQGYMAEIRVTSGVARYTADFTPPTVAYPDGAGEVSGTVVDGIGAAAVRMLRAMRRGTGEQVAVAVSGTGDANYHACPLLLRADAGGAPSDGSQSGRTATVVGGVTIDPSVRSLYGAAMLFDGSTGHVTLPNSVDFSGAGAAFTAEARVRPNAAKLQSILGKQSNGVAREWVLYLLATGQARLQVFSAAGATTILLDSTATVAVNSWADLAVVRTAAGVWYLFVNGAVEGSATETAVTGTNADSFVIGRHIGFAGTRDFTGHIEVVRLTRGVARYTAAYTPTTRRFPEKATGTDGAFSFYTPTLDELILICQDNDAGAVENDRLLRVIPA